MTACERSIGGFAFQPISQEEGKEHGDGSFDQISIGDNGVFKSPGRITVLLNGEWFILQCKIYHTDDVFSRAARAIRSAESESDSVELWREQDIQFFLPDEGIIARDPEGRLWWFHSPDNFISYAVDSRYIWRIDERSGIPFRYPHTVFDHMNQLNGRITYSFLATSHDF